MPANSPIKNAKDLAAAGEEATSPRSPGPAAPPAASTTSRRRCSRAPSGADAAKVNYIPFSGGGESLAAILGGKVTAGISGWGEYEGQIKAGKLRAIGVTSPQRLPGVDVPTFKEQGVDLVITNWRSVVAPPGITPTQKKTLTDAIDKLVKSTAWAGHPQAERLGRRLSVRRRLRDLPQAGTGARRAGC